MCGAATPRLSGGSGTRILRTLPALLAVLRQDIAGGRIQQRAGRFSTRRSSGCSFARATPGLHPSACKNVRPHTASRRCLVGCTHLCGEGAKDRVLALDMWHACHSPRPPCVAPFYSLLSGASLCPQCMEIWRRALPWHLLSLEERRGSVGWARKCVRAAHATNRRSMEAADGQHGLQVPSASCLQPLRQVVLQRVAHKIEHREVAKTCRMPRNTNACQRLILSPRASQTRASRERARAGGRWRLGRSCTLLCRHLRCSLVCFEENCRADRGP